MCMGWCARAYRYVFVIDAVLDRRPYIDETTGRILMRCNSSLLGAAVDVKATIPTLPAGPPLALYRTSLA